MSDYDGLIKVSKKLMSKLDFDNAFELLNVPVLKKLEGKKLNKLYLELENYKTNKNDRKVDFFIVGAQKAGTSALMSFINSHPEICGPKLRKELHYFDSSIQTANHANYHRCFFPSETHKILGEATPIYMFYPGALEKIHAYNPDAKIIICLRDPISRLYSQFNMKRERFSKRGKDVVFDIDSIIDEFNDGNLYGLGNSIRRGLYSTQLDKVFSIFPEENVLITTSDRLKTSHDEVMAEVFKFLGVSSYSVPSKSVHSHKYASRMTKMEHDILVKIFEDDVRVLREKFNIDTSGWLEY